MQSIPVIAEQVDELVVFQRSAAYSRPSNTRRFKPGEFSAMKLDYPSLRAKERLSPTGSIYSGALAAVSAEATKSILETPVEERLATIDELGWVARSPGRTWSPTSRPMRLRLRSSPNWCAERSMTRRLRSRWSRSTRWGASG